MKIDQLSLNINDKTLLHEICFEVPPASLFAILGPNGAGKTLLLRCLADLLSPSSGTILGRPEKLAWVPLSQALPFGFVVRDLVLMGRYSIHQGFAQAEDRRITDAAIHRIGIETLANRSYNSLSRGEQTKVDIARALASESKLILLDEPFSNLDIDAALQLTHLFHELRDDGKTLIFSHHDLHTLALLATHGLLLKQGRILQCGPLSEIFQASAIEEAYNVKAIFQQSGEHQFVRFESLSCRS
ncbi:MAG: ABC transporter ATP-binding protein [Oligoflexus sp.]|nr:ABC transporter ATP-binding protein [Oligoflexus sp.]